MDTYITKKRHLPGNPLLSHSVIYWGKKNLFQPHHCKKPKGRKSPRKGSIGFLNLKALTEMVHSTQVLKMKVYILLEIIQRERCSFPRGSCYFSGLFFPPNIDASNICLPFLLHVKSSFPTKIGDIPQCKGKSNFKRLTCRIQCSPSF